MALTTIINLETHGSGTVGLSGIVDGNWSRLDSIFNPALSSGDIAYGAFWKAFVRNASDPTTANSKIAWHGTSPIWEEGHATLSYSSPVALDFHDGRIQDVSITGNLNLNSFLNNFAGEKLTMIVRGDASSRNFSFPGGWVWVGNAEPASLAANKTARFVFESTGTTDADIVVTYTVEA